MNLKNGIINNLIYKSLMASLIVSTGYIYGNCDWLKYKKNFKDIYPYIYVHLKGHTDLYSFLLVSIGIIRSLLIIVWMIII